MSDSPIAAMFDRISPKYDRLNHLLSLNIDKIWRRKTAKIVAKSQPQTILDLATGTADLAIALAKHNPQAHVIGVDFSEKMLEIGREKIKRQHLENRIDILNGNAVALTFEDCRFDAVTCAFGVRNIENLEKGLSEISRITKQGGKVYILEFSMPDRFPVKQFYRFYFNHILPRIGKAVSKDAEAYSYLPESVEKFSQHTDFQRLLSEKGLESNMAFRFSFGIATLYTSCKR